MTKDAVTKFLQQFIFMLYDPLLKPYEQLSGEALEKMASIRSCTIFYKGKNYNVKVQDLQELGISAINLLQVLFNLREDELFKNYYENVEEHKTNMFQPMEAIAIVLSNVNESVVQQELEGLLRNSISIESQNA